MNNYIQRIMGVRSFKITLGIAILAALLLPLAGCGGGDGGGGGSTAVVTPPTDSAGGSSNTTLSGYLYDNQTYASAPALGDRSPLRAPAAGRPLTLVHALREYNATTDAEGFWKIDVEARDSSSVAILKVKNLKTGLLDSTEIVFDQGRSHMLKLYIEQDARLKVMTKTIGEFVKDQPLSTTKAEVTAKIEEIKLTGSNVPTITGTVISDLASTQAPAAGPSRASTTTEMPGAGIPGVKVTLSGNGVGRVTNTDDRGFFRFDGIFIAGEYTLTAERTGYPAQQKKVVILAENYGFAMNGVLFKLSVPSSLNTAPLLTIITTENNSGEVTIRYNLNDLEGDSCSISLYYSLDAGTNYTKTMSATGETAGVTVGNNRALIWISGKDLTGAQSNVRLKLVPNDGKLDGAAAQTQTFALTPRVIAPVITPGAGAYSSPQTVSIATQTAGATIRYTTDGTTPTSTSGTVYSAPFTLSTATTLKVIALKDGLISSEVVSAAYSFDMTSASLTSWDFNLQTGQLTLNFNKLMRGSSTTVTQIKLYNAVSGAISYQLTDSTASTQDNSAVVITLSVTDLAAIRNTAGLCKSRTDSFISLGATAISDTAGIAARQITASEAMQAANFVSESTNPLISIFSVSTNNANPARARSGDVVTVKLKPRDALSGSPTIKIANQSATVTSAADGSYNGAYTMLGTDAEGTVAVYIKFTTATAAVAETTLTTDGSYVIYDRTAPSVALTYSANPVKAGPLTITAAYSEDVKLGETPKISIDQKGSADVTAQPMTQGVNRKTWTYAYTITAADGSAYVDGTAAVTLSGAGDESGNSALAATNNIFTIDTSAPAAPSAPTATAGPEINAVEEQSGFEVEVPLGSSGAQAGDSVELLLAGSAFPAPLIKQLSAADITAAKCTFIVASGQLGAVGAKSITARVVDAAGNAGAQSAALSLTYTNLTSLSMQYYSDAAMTTSLGNSPRLKAGTYYIKITSSETLSQAPKIAINAEGSLNDVAETSTTQVNGADFKNFYYTRTIVSDTYAVGLVTESVSLARPGYTGAMSLDVGTRAAYTDTTKPTLTSASISSNGQNKARAKTGDILTLTLAASEALLAAPTVTIAGQAATVTGTGPYSAAYTMKVTDTEGVVPFAVNFTDLAGNAGTQVTATTDTTSVTFDRTAPTLTVVKIASNNPVPTRAKPGDVLTFNLTASEALSANPTVKINGTVSATVTAGAANTYTATHTLQTSDTEGVLVFAINFSDASYNAGTQVTATTDASSVTYDRTAPTLSAVAISSSNATSTLAKTGDTITLALTASEPLSGSPTVTIDGQAATLAGGGPYNATYVMKVTDAEGYLPFTVDIVDASGNSGNRVTATTNNSAVRFDRTAPAVSSAHLASLAFDNANGTVKSNLAMTYPETCEVQIYIGNAADPNSPSQAMTASEASFVNTHAAGDTVISGIAAGQAAALKVCYRLIDQAGNASGWTQDGTVPAAPTLPAATSLILAGDGGNGAPAAYINGFGAATVTMRPFPVNLGGTNKASLNGNEELTLTIVSGNTIKMKATSRADGVVPVFGGSTPNVTYTLSTAGYGSTTTGSLNFNGATPPGTALTEGNGNIPVTAQFTDANGNISQAGAAVNITFDKTAPTLNTWVLNTNTGMVFNFSDNFTNVNASSLSVGGNITLQNTLTNPTHFYALTTSNSASTGSVPSLTVSFSSTDRDAINANVNIGTNTGNSYIKINSGAIRDVAGNTIGLTNLQASSVGSDTTPPSAPAATTFYLDNSAGKVYAKNAMTYSEKGYLEIYVGAAADPNSPVQAATASEGSSVTSHAAGDAVITGMAGQNAGDKVCFRIKDLYGNYSAWVQNGTVPAAPTAAAIATGANNSANYISNSSKTAPVVTVTPVNGQTAADQLFATITAGATTVTNSGGTGVANPTNGAATGVTLADCSALADGALTVKAFIKNSSTGNVSALFNGTAGNKDITAPTISKTGAIDFIKSNNATTTKAKTGDNVIISLTANEPLLANPTATVAGNAVAGGNIVNTGGNDYTVTYTMAGTETEGTVSYSIISKDVAGNTTTTTTNPAGDSTTVTYDKTVPTMTSVNIKSNNSNTARAKTGNIITLTMTASEALLAKPTVTIAGNAIAAGSITNTSGTTYTAVYTLTGAEAEAAVPFTIDFTDAAGNAGVQKTTTTDASLVTYDKTAPTYNIQYYTDSAMTAAVPDNSTKKAGVYYMKITPVETLLTRPTVSIDAQGTANDISSGSTASGTGGTYTFVRSIAYDAAATGGVLETITITGTDLAGNVGTSAPANAATKALMTDTVAPTFTARTIASNNAVNPATKAKTGDLITLTLTASETLAANPTVTISGQAALVAGGAPYTATYTMQAGDAEGVVAFSVSSFSDAAGNAGTTVSTTTNASSITYDKTAPTVSSVTTDTVDGYYNGSATIIFKVNFSEPVTVTGGPPTLTLNNAAAVNYTAGTGTSTLTFNYTPAANAADLGYQATNSIATGGGAIADTSGNAATLTLPATNVFTDAHAIVIDITAPAIPTAGQLAKLSFNNNTGQVIAGDLTGADAYPETGYIDLYIGAAADPNSPVQAATKSESTAVASHASNDIIFSGIALQNATDKVCYRFRDRAGNYSAWTQDGTVPSMPVLPVAATLIQAGDGGTNAPAAAINGTIVKNPATMRPGIALNNGEALTITISKGSTSVSMKAASSAAATTPIFGGTTANITYTGHGDTVTGKVYFADTTTMPEGTDLSVTAFATDVGGNTSKTSAAVTVTYDKTSPTVSSWALDKNQKKLTLNFAETMNSASLAVASLSIQQAQAGGSSYTLTNSTTASANGTQIVIDLSAADITAINANSNIATSLTNSWLVIGSGLIRDANGNQCAAIVSTSAFQAASFNSGVPPAVPDVTKLSFDNRSSGASSYDVTTPPGFSSSKQAKLQIYIGSSTPGVSTSPTGSEALSTTVRAIGATLINNLAGGPFTAGHGIYYRFIDDDGNLTNWVQDGVVSTPPNLPASTSLLLTGDGGSGAYPGSVNNDGKQKAKFRPGISLAAGAALGLVATNGGSVEWQAQATINNVIPVFGATTSGITYTKMQGVNGTAPADSINFSDSGVNSGSVSCKAYYIDTAGNVSNFGTAVTVSYDITAPTDPQGNELNNIYFDNSTGKVMANGTYTNTNSDIIAVEIYIGTAVPGAATPATATEATTTGGHTSGDTIISGIPPQSPAAPSNLLIYYRFADSSGNRSNWIQDGYVPMAPTAAAIKVSAGVNSANYISNNSKAAPIVSVTPVNGQAATDRLYATISSGGTTKTNNGGTGVANPTSGAATDVTIADCTTFSDGALAVKAYIKDEAAGRGNISATITGTPGTKDVIAPALASYSIDMYTDADTKSITLNFSENVAIADLDLTVANAIQICRNDGTNSNTVPSTVTKTQLGGNSIKLTKLGAPFVVALNAVAPIINGVASSYYIKAAAGAFKDMAGNGCALKGQLTTPLNPSVFNADTRPAYIVGFSNKSGSPVNINSSNSILSITYNDYMISAIAPLPPMGNTNGADKFVNYVSTGPLSGTDAATTDSRTFEINSQSGWIADNTISAVSGSNPILDTAGNGITDYHQTVKIVNPADISLITNVAFQQP